MITTNKSNKTTKNNHKSILIVKKNQNQNYLHLIKLKILIF